ncbi:glutathionylspermidine synthase family protein [Limnoglobus roseus]|uniref:Glutathionylspermidine synthase family protein n=1 Tax=Limnoglobus roseus TaxID=2598579 RepID=A0A5C1AQV0_9BACT|nr:glutathionylspermidine synthase family protein [Limnoglobus roseus]QEL20995.1 glutathionylspermidine synthase family protein [Limnoglobus roseus]
MRRRTLDPRPNWQQRVEQYGLHFHTLRGEPYWDESACYTFSKYEIDTIERATYALFDMCVELVQHVIDEKMFGLFLIPPEYEDLVVQSWDDEHPSIYGRFDLAFDGVGPPKMLEFNADTPTGLVEAGVAQWFWLKDVDERADQFNSIHERLIEGWKHIHAGDDTPIHFAAISGEVEDYITVEYLRDTAIQAGFKTDYLDVEAIGWDQNRRTFVDRTGRPIQRIFKLYPWEWLIRDNFGKNILQSKTRWMEPAWKMILSSKSILPLLHQLNPDSPYLLPAWFDEPESGDYVRKPIHAREGANIRVVRNGRTELETDGPYQVGRDVVYQQLFPLPSYDGRYPVIGSWVINGWAAGIGIREDDGIVTTNTSRFIPHQMTD